VSVLATLVVAVFAAAAYADRAPVLRQIKVPHDYYYREMYLPELTTGPGGVAWSPDGRWLVYSMAGSLWKQRIGSTTAEELTAGSGYDYQPDWSHDGRRIVFVRYLHDAEELCTLDLATGTVSELTRGGDVNLEPRWSPDGSRIAFVSTKGTGHFHIYIGAFAKAGFAATPWLKERKSRITRYYYSPFDQQLSPTWSPDGRDLIYVDNPETGYGSGSLWRRPVDRSNPARLIHREETNWKAAPDWSPDGKRLIYSSYGGRQSNQLWIVTTTGEDYPLPLTYGDYDVTRPRWSPDASRFAYISNQDKNTSIWIQDAVGGARRRLQIADRIYKRSMGRLALTIVDGSGKAIPARVAVLGSDGRAYAPDQALMRGDDSFDRDRQAFETHYFQTGAAAATVTLPVGKASITVWHGDEYAISRATAVVAAGETQPVRITLHKLDLPSGFAAWQGGDAHVHMNYGGTYRTEPVDLVSQARAEDLDLVFDLVVNKEQRVPDISRFSSLPDPASTPDVLLAHSQEYHSSYWGHLGIIGLDDHYLVPGYAGYPYTGSASLYPDNTAVTDLAHAQHALVGYAHPFDVAPDPDRDATITDELPIDVALGKADYYEVVGFSNHRESASIWYRLLNCGFRLPAAAGTDAMTNYASLRGPVGLARVFVLPDTPSNSSPLAREKAWLAGLKAGRSMATNGPLLGFAVGTTQSGGEIDLPAGEHAIHYSGWLRSLTGIDHLEVILNGKVIKSVPLPHDRTRADVAGGVTLHESGWLLLRAWNDHATPDVFDLYPYATTGPVFVTIGRKAVRSRTDAEFFIKWIDKVKASAAANRDYNTRAERDAVMAHIDDARRVFEGRRAEAGL
jgi:hypothetical protein